jgi:hypothetical protein
MSSVTAPKTTPLKIPSPPIDNGKIIKIRTQIKIKIDAKI